jgi:tetratricopeptide (TPR) repeat protein
MHKQLILAPVLVIAGLSGTASGQDVVLDAFAKSYKYEKAQNYEDAIKSIVILKNQDYLVHLRLGWLYYLSGNHANSRQHYQKAMATAPKAIEPRLGYMLPLLAQARYAEVETVARQVLTMDAGNYYASLRLAIALRMQGKLAQAAEVNNAMLGLYPTDISFLNEMGLVLFAQKDYAAARQAFYRVLTLDPENVVAKRHLAPPPPAARSSRGRVSAPSNRNSWFGTLFSQ